MFVKEKMKSTSALTRKSRSSAALFNLVGRPLVSEKPSNSRATLTSNTIGLIQTKLSISSPGDRYEEDADRIAEQIMRMPEPTVQRAPT